MDGGDCLGMRQWAREGSFVILGRPTCYFGQFGLGFGLGECVSLKGGMSFREWLSEFRVRLGCCEGLGGAHLM